MEIMEKLVSEDGFEMDSASYCRKSRTRLQAAQDLFTAAAVLKECSQELETLDERRREIYTEVNELKNRIEENIADTKGRIENELNKLDEEHEEDTKRLVELSKLKAKCGVTGEEFEEEELLDTIHGRIASYDIRRQAVEELMDEIVVDSADQECLDELEREEYRIIQQMESIISAFKMHYLLLAEDAKKKISIQSESRTIQIMKDGYADKYRLRF